MSSFWSKRKQHGKTQLHYTDSGIRSVTEVGITAFPQQFHLCQTASTKGFFLDLLIQTNIYLIYYGDGEKNPKPGTTQSFILFTLCFSTFPSPSNNQPASKFALQIKWANENSTTQVESVPAPE